MDADTWLYSKVIEDDTVKGFNLIDDELPIFYFKSPDAENLVTTRRIIEKKGSSIITVNISQIDKTNYGLFKGVPNTPVIGNFIVTTDQGKELIFSMETWKASVGLIKSINTLRNLNEQV